MILLLTRRDFPLIANYFQFAKFVTKGVVYLKESKVAKRLIAKIEQLGGLCLKNEIPTYDGFPDRTVLLPGGLVYFVETKASKGKLSDIQKLTIPELRALGLNVEVIYTYEEVDQFIKTVSARNR